MFRHPPGKPEIGFLFFRRMPAGSDSEVISYQFFIRILKKNSPEDPFDLESSPVLTAVLGCRFENAKVLFRGKDRNRFRPILRRDYRFDEELRDFGSSLGINHSIESNN